MDLRNQSSPPMRYKSISIVSQQSFKPIKSSIDNPFDPFLDRGSPFGFSVYQQNDAQADSSPAPMSLLATPFRNFTKQATKLPAVHLLHTPDSTRNDLTLNESNSIYSTKQPNLFSMFVEDTRSTSPIPVRLPPFKDSIQRPTTPAHIAIPVLSMPDNDYSSDDDTPNQTLNGLKNLSIAVRDIVDKRGPTTYKDVADAIVADLPRDQQALTHNPANVSRESQNIKRRVYDALNVLISAGVLVKEGKTVSKNDDEYSNQKLNSKLTEINSISAKIVC